MTRTASTYGRMKWFEEFERNDARLIEVIFAIGECEGVSSTAGTYHGQQVIIDSLLAFRSFLHLISRLGRLCVSSKMPKIQKSHHIVRSRSYCYILAMLPCQLGA